MNAQDRYGSYLHICRTKSCRYCIWKVKNMVWNAVSTPEAAKWPLTQHLKRCVNGQIAASHVDTAFKTAIEQRNTVLFPKIMNVQDRYGLYIHICRIKSCRYCIWIVKNMVWNAVSMVKLELQMLTQRLKRCVNGQIAASHIDTAFKTSI